MENASKALIIAGSILISILIIGIGVFIYNGVRDSFDTGSVDEQKVQAYNEPFLRYEGDQKSGSEARALCEAIRTHNLKAGTDDSQKVGLVVKDGAFTASDVEAKNIKEEGDVKITAQEITKYKNKIKTGYTYNITFGYDSKTGYVTQVGIAQN